MRPRRKARRLFDRSPAWLSLAGLLFAAANALSQPARDILVIAGAGLSNSWNTEFDLANPGPAPLTIEIGRLDVPLSEAQCGSIPPCIFAVDHRVIPPSGTLHTNAYSIGAGIVSTFYVVPLDPGGALPVVHARVVDRDHPSRGADIPVVRRSTLSASRDEPLSFPGASRGPGGHTNLILAEVSARADVQALVEVFSPSGERLAGRNFHIERDFALGRGGTVFLVDVLALLGIPELDGGQIRVTAVSGEGLLWGLATHVSEDGGMSVAVGKNF
jgi:hypothetical protein